MAEMTCYMLGLLGRNAEMATKLESNDLPLHATPGTHSPLKLPSATTAVQDRVRACSVQARIRYKAIQQKAHTQTAQAPISHFADQHKAACMLRSSSYQMQGRSTEGCMKAPLKLPSTTTAVQQKAACKLRSSSYQLPQPFNQGLHTSSV